MTKKIEALRQLHNRLAREVGAEEMPAGGKYNIANLNARIRSLRLAAHG